MDPSSEELLMEQRHNKRFNRGVCLAAMSLVLAAGSAMPVWAIEPDGPEPVTTTDAAPMVRFNFKNAPFDQVLDFFSRQTGLPIIKEAEVPAASMTFISARDYTLSDALSILNLNLKMHGVHLRRENNFLYLSSIKGAFAKPTPVVDSKVPDSVTPDEIVTVTIPLSNANAMLVAEQIKPLIGAYGGVTPVAAQNMLILVESAAQVRRIGEIIRTIDAEKPVDSSFKLYPLKHAEPDEVVNALKGLIGVRKQQVIIDPNGKKRIVEELDVAGVNMQADKRTRSVVVVGPEARIAIVDELIALLDQPEGDLGEQQMATFALETITPAEAAKHLAALFKAVPKNRQPTVLALPEVGKVTVVGPSTLLAQATALIGEIDPAAGPEGQPRDASPDRLARVLRLKHVRAQQIEQIASRLLSPRQRQMLRYTPTPDGKGLILAGPPDDVAAFETLISGIDVSPEIQRDVRLVTISARDPKAIIRQAEELYAKVIDDDTPPISMAYDEDARTLTLIGTREQVTRFESLMRTVESAAVIKTESRSYELTTRTPSELARELPRVVRPLLERSDGEPYRAPDFEPIDELETLIVRAEPEQFAVIEQLITRLDTARPGDTAFRVIRLPRGDAKEILARAQSLYDLRAATMDTQELGELTVSLDEPSGNLLVTASPGAMSLFSESLTQAQQLLPPARTTRIIDIQHLDADQILEPLRELLASADSIDPSRAVPTPVIQTIERTNSLMVTAEDAQHRLIQDFVRRLDQIEPTDLPPLKLLQLRTADANAIASMLTQQYSKRPQADRAARPVEVRADAATNTLIVSAHPELFDEIKAFVDDLNTEQQEGPERITFLFTLKVAKAVDVAAAMDKLYPQPPMPRDRRGNPLPWLQKDKEVTVSADPSSNSLIIDAPADRRISLEELAEKLDRVEVPPVAELRTYHIEGADLQAIARTLTALSRGGNLSAPAQPGKQSVRVLIETEPLSSTLIVAGDDITFERVEKMLTDLSAVPIEKSLRIIPIANSQASAVRDRAIAIYNAQVAQIPGANPVDVTVNEETNSLEVVADTEAMDRFMRVLDELQRQVGPARETRLIELRIAKVETVVSFLDDLIESSASLRAGGGADPIIEAIESTNTLLVAAQPAQLPIIEELVRNMDNQETAERAPLRILKLRSTDAVNLAGVLQRSYDQRPIDERSKKPVTIQADPATNTLIVSASDELIPEIEQLIDQLNEAQAFDAEGREIRIYPLKVARAEELARTIDAMFPDPPMPYDPRTRRPRPDLRQPKEVVVRADRATNSLIVDAPAKRLAGFEQLVKSLDQHKLAADVELRTYRIKRAELSAVTTTLNKLAQNGALGATGQTPVTIETEPVSRTLIVSGPSEIFAQVDKVLAELEITSDLPPTTIRLYALKHARAERLAPLLERLLEQRLREQTLEEGMVVQDAGAMLEVAPDGASNTLIISAPEAIQQIAQQLIESLDVEAAAMGRPVVRVVPLTYADASQVSQTLIKALPSIDLPSGGTVTIIPAAGSNALLLSGAQKDLEKIEELLEPLDQQPSDSDTPIVETFALKHADAKAIAQTVQRLLSDQLQNDPRVLAAQLRYYRGRIPSRASVRVEADARTNGLIVSGPAATVQLAKAIIDRLDQPDEDANTTVLTFTPKQARASQLVSTVQRIVDTTMPQGRERLSLTAEPASGSIIAMGPPEQVAQAIKLLGEFDDRAIAMPPVELQVFPVEHADARVLAGSVQGMLADSSRWPEVLRRAADSGLMVTRPTVGVDSAGNRLLVSVPTPLMPLARELIATLDQPSSKASVEVRVFTLDRGDASSIARALTQALRLSVEPGQPQPVVTAEPNANAVVIAANPQQMDRAVELVASLDTAVDTEGVGVRTVFLKNARAERIAPLVEQILSKQSDLDLIPEYQRWSYLSRRRPGDTTEQPVKVVAESRLNALVISAPLAALELAEQVIDQLDRSPDDPATSGRVVRVISPINASAADLARTVSDLFAGDDLDEQPPIIRPDAASNTLIVRGSREQIDRIESLVNEIDRATVTSGREMRLIRVDRSKADADAMAATLKQLLERSGGVRVEVISADELLDQPDKPENQSRLDEPSTTGAVRSIPQTLLDMVFSAVEPGVQIPAATQPEGDRAVADQPDAGAQVTIAVDPETNSILVIGSSRMADRIAQLASAIEQQMPAEPTSVRVVTLPQSADARGISNIVRETIRQVGRASSNNPGGFTGRVAVSPDPTGGSVIVWANDTDFRVLGSLIGSLSQAASSEELVVKIYPLDNIKAVRAVRSVQDLVSPRPQGRQARRLRTLDMTLTDEDGQAVTASVDPSKVSVTADPSGVSLIVTAPADTIPLIDSFIGLIDQSPVTNRMAIRRYALDNAKAVEMVRTLQQLFDAQRSGSSDVPRARFVADPRTNALLVTASDDQHAEVTRLLAQADADLQRPDLAMEIITLQQAQPTTVQKVIQQVIVGRNPGKEDEFQISADNSSSVLVVSAPAESMPEIKRIVEQVDRADTAGLPLRTLKLDQADAQVVAQSLSRFFQSRAQAMARPGRRVTNRIAIVGDRASGTLVVAAPDDDFAQIEAMVATFDERAPSKELQIRVIELENARVSDIQDSVENLAFSLTWGGGRRNQTTTDPIYTQFNERTNSVILMGTGETLATVERIVDKLDVGQSDQTQRVVRAVKLERADLQAVSRVVEQAMENPGRSRWWQPDPDGVQVEVDRQRRMLLVIGSKPRVEMAMDYIEQIDQAATPEGQQIRSIALDHAQADRAARSLNQFFRDRARNEGLSASDVSVIGSPDGNVLIVSARAEDLAIVEDLVAQIDQPDLGDDRLIDVFVLKNAPVNEAASTIRSMFPARRADQRVIVTPQPSSSSLIVSAPASVTEDIKTLIAQVDRAPSTEDISFETITLETARADDVARSLASSLPPNLKIQITPVARSNSLILTGSDEAIELVRGQISQLDTEPARPSQEFKRVRLSHAMADDVWMTLSRMMRARRLGPNEPASSIDYSTEDNALLISATRDQMREIDAIIKQLDVDAGVDRKTEFVKLEFADAEQTAKALEVFYGRYAPEAGSPAARSVTIVPDPASSSLVISADESEWTGIRALLDQLDTADYATGRQITVIPLVHADAQSVARALNEGFQASVNRQVDQQRLRIEQERQRRGDGRNDTSFFAPTVLVTDDENPTVSAESQTNSLIVFASNKDLERIRAIIKQLDVPDILKLPEPRVIPLESGRASQVARAVREMFANAATRSSSPRGVLIFGDDTSNSIIVRADDDQFEQIRALTLNLQDRSAASRPSPRVRRIEHVPAARLRQTIMSTFSPLAQQAGETLTIELDRASNALVIASSERLYEQINNLIDQLDTPPAGSDDRGDETSEQIPTPGFGQTVRVVPVEHNAPNQIILVLTQLGVTRPQPADRPGLVSEPVTLVALPSRGAVAVVASPIDAETVASLVSSLDREPIADEQSIKLVPLKLAEARAVVQTLEQMLAPASGGRTGAGSSLAEQIRRLSISQTQWEREDLRVDLTKPVRLIPVTQSNAVAIASTPGNIKALSEVIALLDTLPVGDAVVVRIFPLDNTSATRVRSVIEELFRQGEALRRLPGTERRGLPSTTTGQALAGEIAVSVDERTNALIVAGREEAVAFVDVLIRDLDSDETASWVEPTLIPLKHADPVKLAATLRSVLVEGTESSAEALGLRQQIARLRLAEQGKDPRTAKPIEADLFVPMGGLVITPEENLRALIVVGTTNNVRAVDALVRMLDVEAAGLSNAVRVFPLEHAAADRVARIVRDVFREREQVGAIRQEDRLIVASDVRTNALIVSSSPRSMEILEGLLDTLDVDESSVSVGLHVIAVPGADVLRLAPKLERLMRERITASRRAGVPESPSDALSIEPEPATSSLIIAASDENLQIIQELITTLTSQDLADTDASTTEVIYLQTGQASDVGVTINDLYVTRENDRRGDGAVSVIANDRLNALIVSGTPEDIETIRGLVKEFDTAQIVSQQDIKRIELKTANALEVVNLLEEILAGRPISGSRGQAKQATRIRYYRSQLTDSLEDQLGHELTEAEIDGAIRDQIRLTPDLRTNSVMIAAPPELMALIEGIIADLDSTTAGNREIEVFRLKNADARAMQTVLGDLFNLRQQGNNLVLLPTSTPNPDNQDDQNLFGGTTVTPVPDERQELSITIDPRTNSLLVSGTAEYLELVRHVVESLDNIEATEREQFVFHLRNAKADEVQTTLESYFRDEAQRIRDTLGNDQLGSLARQLEQEVTIVGDTKSNKLVISASPRYIDTVRSIIEELDAAPPQVVIQVLLAEVTVDTARSWGVDIEVGPFGGENYVIGSTPAGASVATALGVPNLSVSSGDFSLLIRSLQAQGKLEVLSRPELTVNNNETASIQVGENVAIIESVDTFELGRSQANVTRRDVGIEMNVTPSISVDGFVRMEIAPSISSLSTRTTQISENFEAPIITQRQVDTTVTVKDGQTVVIGGLIQTTKDHRTTKVPGLGDLPFVGGAFRTSTDSMVRTELLVILTPTVIGGGNPEDVLRQRLYSERAIDTMTSGSQARQLIEGTDPLGRDQPKTDSPGGVTPVEPGTRNDPQQPPRSRKPVPIIEPNERRESGQSSARSDEPSETPSPRESHDRD